MTMTDAPSKIRLKLADFMQQFSDEGPFEIIDGEKFPLAPQAPISGDINFLLARLLADFVEEHTLGRVFVEVPFVMTDPNDPNWVTGSRVPDAMFYDKSRIDELAKSDPDWRLKPIPLPPDLAVEVISPSDRFSAVSKKIDGYLSDGVRLVWVVDPTPEEVIIYRPGSQPIRLGRDDTLSGDDVVANFAISVARLFAV
jgi:Uma2 family endonuclease